MINFYGALKIRTIFKYTKFSFEKESKNRFWPVSHLAYQFTKVPLDDYQNTFYVAFYRLNRHSHFESLTRVVGGDSSATLCSNTYKILRIAVFHSFCYGSKMGHFLFVIKTPLEAESSGESLISSGMWVPAHLLHCWKIH